MEKKKKFHIARITGLAVFNLICLFSIIYVIVTATDKDEVVGEEPGVNVIDDFEIIAPPKALIITDRKEKGAEETYEIARAESAETYEIAKAESAPASSVASQSDLQSSVIIDDFEGDEIRNRLGSRANVYVRAPSRVMIAKRKAVRGGINTSALMVKYDKKNTGGPNGMGGWCGYYTLIKNQKTGKYFDGSEYSYITLWVKGEKGDENFKLGLADEHWDKVGDSLKSEEIGMYLPEGQITTSWQKAKVPLEIFFLDHASLGSITVNFESECFPEGAGSGIIYIDDIALEQ